MNHKKETPEPEQHINKAAPKKAAPKKGADTKPARPPRNRKKILKSDEELDEIISRSIASAQRIAEPEPSVSISHTLAPATIVTTTEQTRQDVDMQELREQFGHKDIPHEIEEEVKERATGVWSKTKTLWGKYGWIPVVAVLLIAVIFGYLYFARDKRDKSEKEMVTTENNILHQKEDLRQTENNLQDLQHRRVDSNYRAKLQSIFEQLKTASDQYEAYHAQMIERNEMYKKTNDALQEKIRTASDDSLLRIGRQLSK